MLKKLFLKATDRLNNYLGQLLYSREQKVKENILISRYNLFYFSLKTAWHFPLTHPQLPCPQSRVPGSHSKVQKISSQLGALFLETQLFG